MIRRRIWHKETCTDSPCTCGAASAHVADMEERVDMAEGSELHLSAMLKDAVVGRDHARAAYATLRAQRDELVEALERRMKACDTPAMRMSPRGPCFCGECEANRALLARIAKEGA